MSNAKISAMRQVCATHIIKEVVRPGSFFWLLSHGRPDHQETIADTITEVLEAWTPPTFEDLSDEIISGWIDKLKFECLIKLYQAFGAECSEAHLAAKVWS